METAWDPPEHLQDGHPQRRSLGRCVALAGAEQHRVVGDGAQGGRGGQEVVQVAAGDRAQLLLQVDALSLGHAGCHRQALEGAEWSGLWFLDLVYLLL